MALRYPGYTGAISLEGILGLTGGVGAHRGASATIAAPWALPGSAFEAIMPVFIAIALVAVVLQPRLDRLVAEHRPPPEAHGTGLPRALVHVAGVYGGYFGAAQGILLLAILGLALPG